MQNKQLKAWGLPTNLADQTYPRGLIMGRVVGQNHTMYKVKTAADERQAAVSGRLANLAIEAQDYPAVGDWVFAKIQQVPTWRLLSAYYHVTVCFYEKRRDEKAQPKLWLLMSIPFLYVWR